jgi:hypothetical protein
MGELSLVEAAKQGDVAAVKSWLDRGHDINAFEKTENSLTIASWTGQIEVVRLLLARGAALGVKEGTGRTPIALAQLGKHHEIERLLAAAATGERPQPPRFEPQKESETWVRMGEDGIARVGVYPALEKKLTHIFNFGTRERVIIADDLRTGAQSMTPPTGFDELPPAAIEKALAALAEKGGLPDRDFVLYARNALNKAKKEPALK